MLKLFGAVGAAGVVTPALAACSPNAATARPTGSLSIGLVYPESGPMQDVGFEMLTA